MRLSAVGVMGDTRLGIVTSAGHEALQVCEGSENGGVVSQDDQVASSELLAGSVTTSEISTC